LPKQAKITFSMAGFRSGFDGFAERDFNGLFDGVVVDAATDGGEGEGVEIVPARELEAGSIATGKQFGLVVASAVPNRAYRVENVLCGQAIALGELGVAGLAAAEQAAFMKKIGPAAR